MALPAAAHRKLCGAPVDSQWDRTLCSSDGECAPVKHVGEPCAGELHARFDGGWLETDRRVLAIYAPTEESSETARQPYSVTAPAAYPTNSNTPRPQPVTPLARRTSTDMRVSRLARLFGSDEAYVGGILLAWGVWGVSLSLWWLPA